MKRIKIDGGLICPKCGQPMQRYEHPTDWVPRPGRNYFRWWDYCGPCQHVQHYEQARVTPEREET